MQAKQLERVPRGKKTIFIVDDHPLMRRGLTALIENEPDLAVCGEATTRQGALKGIGWSAPDLVIVDLGLEGGEDGLDLVKELKARYPAIPALVLSMHPETVYAERALRAGARGFVSKQELDKNVLDAIRCLFGGEIYMSDTLAARLARQFVGGHARETDTPLAALSDRELQVFRLLGHGRSTREIAQILNLSMKTIESYREHLKQKLTIESAPELVRRAIRWVETGQIN
jgi:DNA-binding NarL/FixJ family response regulator